MSLHVYGPDGRKDEARAVHEPSEPVQSLRLTGLTADVQVSNVVLHCWPDGRVTWETVKET